MNRALSNRATFNSATGGLPFPFDRRWTSSAAAELACVLEATAPKLGNVHPGASFADMRYGHFLASAAAIGKVFVATDQLSVGALILQSVQATRATVGINTNLGTVLLFAPLAKAAAACESRSRLRYAVRVVLDNLTHEDSKAVYEAIRVANPGGIGSRDDHDVRDAAPGDLVGAMRQVASVDAVARQYTNGFADLFDRLLPWLEESLQAGCDILNAICQVQLRLLAEEPDGLIVRKCGEAIADEVKSLARKVVEEPELSKRLQLIANLDEFLRSDGHRRNPGTSADLIAAMLFARLLISE